MAGIFISYRRDDSAAWAGRLYDQLTEQFGESRIFMDIDDIGPGEDFREAIEHTLGQCDVLLAVIGPDWLASVDQLGERRIDKPNDYLRMEIARALSGDDRVIPILVGGAEMPSEEHLPAVLTNLAFRQAVELTPTHFRRDVQALGDAIERLRNAESTPPPETFAATIAALPEPAPSVAPPPRNVPPRSMTTPMRMSPVALPSLPRAPTRRSRVWPVFAVLVVVLAGVGLAAWAFGPSEDTATTPSAQTQPTDENTSTTDGSTQTTVAPRNTAIAPSSSVSLVSASVARSDSVDACESVTNYEPANIHDGRLETAWMAPGDGTGAVVTFQFSEPTRVQEVGLMPGYDKFDRCSGTDRFYEFRRITSCAP